MSNEERQTKNEEFLNKLAEQLDAKNNKGFELEQRKYDVEMEHCTFNPYVSDRTNEIAAGRKFTPASKSWKKNLKTREDWIKKHQDDKVKELKLLEEESMKAANKSADRKNFSGNSFQLRNKDWKGDRDKRIADKMAQKSQNSNLDFSYDFQPKTNKSYNEKHIKLGFYKRLKSPKKAVYGDCREDVSKEKQCTFKPKLCETSLKIPFACSNPEEAYNKALYKDFRLKKFDDEPKNRSLKRDKELFFAANSEIKTNKRNVKTSYSYSQRPTKRSTK